MKEYSIGVDIGTDSCGIAVIDSDFNLIKAKGKNFWGAIKFDAGETAASRRIYRGARRRQERRKQRIRNFRRFVERDILSYDPSFFHRLEDSFLHNEDRRDSSYRSNLFIEKDFNDKKYYSEYPTIYHLRQRLVSDTSKADLRLIYLAIHHILKYRGHFLHEGQKFSDIVSSPEYIITQLFSDYSESQEINLDYEPKNIINILDNNSLTRKDKVREVIELKRPSREYKAIVENMFNGIVGLQMNVNKIFPDIELQEEFKIKFSDGNIDEKLDSLSSQIGEDYIIIEGIKSIYSYYQLKDILNGSENISSAMIAKYNKFNYDLKTLKKAIKSNCNTDTYNLIFRDISEGVPSYTNYINKAINKNTEENRKAFYNKIKKIFEGSRDGNVDYILSQIEEGKFLIRLNTVENSVIPYQLHEAELEAILNNQGEYYPCLKENKDKIIKILNFRIPYYVGPLGKYGDFKWLKKKEGFEDERILPWNMEQVVDIDATAEKFINRMTSYCTYLPDEKVLPFNSILYTEYLYYNEINKIKFNDEYLDPHAKEELKKDVFMKVSKVTEKSLKDWYRKNNKTDNREVTVTGYQGEKGPNVTLKPIMDFTRIYGSITPDNREEIEKIIYWLTVFEDKKIVKRKLQQETNITEASIKEILKLKYAGWGRFSDKLLEGIRANNRKTILEILKTTNLNFMQIINESEYGFSKIIDGENNLSAIEGINYDRDIKPLQGSPAIKKGIYQSIKQIEEVISVMGCMPNRIYLEFARSDEESKRTLARRDKVLELYNSIVDLDEKDSDIIKVLSDKNLKIDTERLYLYFMQRGKCMYSGNPLDIENLSFYQIDHIIPQSLVKDDSISNKVLVLSEMNQRKSDGSIDQSIIDKNKVWWAELKKYGLISSRKYDNLLSINKGYETKIEKGFINRQLVEVRQISKHVTNLLTRLYGEKGTKIVAIKAGLVDNFKGQYELLKDRGINDMHHAKDAYACAVVGEYIMKRFGSLESEFIYDEYNKLKRKKKLKGKFGFVISSMSETCCDEETGEIIWNAKETIPRIKEIYSYSDCLITKKPEIMSGEMFKVTREPKPENGRLSGKEIPLKANLDPTKYGYYTGKQEAYYSVIEYKKGRNRIKRLVGVPVMEVNKLKGNNDKLKEYFQSEGYEDVVILKNRIPKYQKISYKRHEYYIVSSGEWCNAKQLRLDKTIYDNIAKLNNNKQLSNMDELVAQELTLDIYDKLIDKLESQYKVYSSPIAKIKSGRDKYISLNIDERRKVINEILKLTKANSQCANLKSIGGSEREGRLSSKGNVDVNELTFIYESPTGIHSRKVVY